MSFVLLKKNQKHSRSLLLIKKIKKDETSFHNVQIWIKTKELIPLHVAI